MDTLIQFIIKRKNSGGEETMRPEVCSVKTERFEMEYFSFGHGKEPFVIIPGVSMKSLMPVAPAISMAFAGFREDYTVYLFDRKKEIQSEYCVWDMAEDTSEAMRVLGIQNADIYGASQGGMIAQCIAISHPEQVHALYLASTMARGNRCSDSVMNEWLNLSLHDNPQDLNHSLFTHIYSTAYYQKNRSAFEMLEKQASPEEIIRFRFLVKACREFDVFDRLDEIRCPAVVVGSWQDRVLSGHASVELAEKLRCTLHMYSGYSHAVYDEAPDFIGRMLVELKQFRN